MRNKFATVLITAKLSLLGNFCYAEPTQPVDRVLDMLEKKILDRESEGLSYQDDGNDPSTAQKSKAPVKKSYQFSKEKIEGLLPEKNSVEALGKKIDSLEADIDLLASNVQKAKQSIFDESKMDNFIEIEALLQHNESATLRSLTVKINGFVLYSLPDSSGLWLPMGQMSIYAGPLQPGTHRIDVEARIAVREKSQSIPITGDVYFFVNKSIDLHLPPGTMNLRYIIEIIPPESTNGKADAVIKEAS